MAVTLADLRDQVYELLREEHDTNAYSYVFVDSIINSAYQRICSGKLINPVNQTTVTKLNTLPFLKVSKFYQNASPTTLSETTTVGATTLTVGDTTNYDDAGVIYIQGNIVTYTGKTDTTFTGVSGIDFPFIAGTLIYKLFEIPTDYSNTIQFTYNENYKITFKSYELIQDDLRHNKNNSFYSYTNTYNIDFLNIYYTIINSQYILLKNLSETQYPIILRYEKVPTILSNISDEILFDNDIYGKNTIGYLATGEIFFNRGEEGRGGELINFALGQVREMYNFYQNKEREKTSGNYTKISAFKNNYNF